MENKPTTQMKHWIILVLGYVLFWCAIIFAVSGCLEQHLKNGWNIMKKLLRKIRKIASKDLAAGNLAEMLLYAQEEMGEVAECVSTGLGYKNKPVKEPTHVECIDVIISMFGMYFAAGGKLEDIEKIMDRKSDKWKKRVEKFHVRGQYDY